MRSKGKEPKKVMLGYSCGMQTNLPASQLQGADNPANNNYNEANACFDIYINSFAHLFPGFLFSENLYYILFKWK